MFSNCSSEKGEIGVLIRFLSFAWFLNFVFRSSFYLPKLNPVPHSFVQIEDDNLRNEINAHDGDREFQLTGDDIGYEKCGDSTCNSVRYGFNKTAVIFFFHLQRVCKIYVLQNSENVPGYAIPSQWHFYTLLMVSPCLLNKIK